MDGARDDRRAVRLRRRGLVHCVRVFDRSDCHSWLVSTLMEKRTQRGHSGQNADRSAARAATRWQELASAACVCTSNRFWLPPQQLPSPCSRAVRALSWVSALCPFLHERRDQPRAESSGPMFGVGSLRASLQASPSAIVISDAIP